MSSLNCTPRVTNLGLAIIKNVEKWFKELSHLFKIWLRIWKSWLICQKISYLKILYILWPYMCKAWIIYSWKVATEINCAYVWLKCTYREYNVAGRSMNDNFRKAAFVLWFHYFPTELEN